MTETDVVLIGAGIMSATLGTLLRLVEPDWSITLIERLDGVAKESSDPWHNAGTGHSALCELNYTPESADGSIDITRAVFVNEQFQVSRQFWSHAVENGVLAARAASSIRFRTCRSCRAPNVSTTYVAAAKPWCPTRSSPPLSDQPERARVASEQLTEVATASGSDFARGKAAHARALITDDQSADALYREAIESLSRTRMAIHLARTRLSYGRWLRRMDRRANARAELRSAHGAFAEMGAAAFAEQARHELQGTGEKVRRRSGPGSADLTPQDRSPRWHAIGAPIPRSARSCSSARGLWNGISARSSRNSTSARAASLTQRSPVAGEPRGTCDLHSGQGVSLARFSHGVNHC